MAAKTRKRFRWPSSPGFVKGISEWWGFLGPILWLAGEIITYMTGRKPSNLDFFLLLSVPTFCLVFLYAMKPARAITFKPTKNSPLKNVDPAEIQEINDQIHTIASRAKKGYWAGSLLALVLGSWIFGAAVHRFFTTAIPSSLDFHTTDHFVPSKQKQMLAKYPFLEALNSHLNDEARVEGRQWRTYFLTSHSLPHATPPFLLSASYEENAYELSGYAFIRRNIENTQHFEPVSIEYEQDGSLKLRIPHCEKGDQVFMVTRLSLNHAKAFPSNLIHKIKFTVHSGEN